MSKKLVSVYINAYNAEKFIKETVNSILGQTYSNLKLVVINDGSTDSTLDILSSIEDERLSVYSLPENSHISVTLNEGLKYMDGDYIAHCDADDLWEPKKLQKQIDFMESNPEYGACFTHVNMIDEDSNIDNSLFPTEVYNITNMSQAELLKLFFDTSNRFAHPAFLARKEIIKKVGFYDVSMPTLHDYDYWIRLISTTPVYIIQEPLVLVRRHSGNNSKLDQGMLNCNDSERVRILKKTILECPCDLFLEAFKDEIKFKGKHTPEETLIEKAFVLERLNPFIDYNPIMSIEVFSDILNNPKILNTAKEKFGFTPKKLYELEKYRQYYNPNNPIDIYGNENESSENNEVIDYSNIEEVKKTLNEKQSQLNKKSKEIISLSNTINEKSTIIAEQNNKIKFLSLQLKTISTSKENTINEQTAIIDLLNSVIREYQTSFFWRLTKPMRVVAQVLKNIVSKNRKLLNFCIVLKCFLRHGFSAAKNKYKQLHFELLREASVSQEISKERRNQESSEVFENEVKFSILVPLYNTPKNFLEEMIDSVLNQTYSNWELCLADGSTEEFDYVGKYCLELAEKDQRIVYKKLAENKGISENTNACIDMSTGDYIALFDHDDLLHPSALYEYAKAINEKNADFIYCDEDKFDKIDGKFYDPYFKPDFSPDNLRANNYICHFTVFKKSLLDVAGKFRKEFDGSQDHDLVLRLTEKAENIVHIPKILYRWRVSSASVASDPYAKPYTITAGINAVKEHLERVGLKASVESSPYHPNFYRLKYDIEGNPLISILIPNYNHKDDLDRCIKSIINKSTYKNYEIIIIENNSNKETFDYYETLKKYPNIKVVVYKPVPNEFNYSKINNFGFKYANGDHILLLNNDIEIISPDWLQEMLMFSQREDVGAVGAKLYFPNDTIQHAGVILGIGGIAGHAYKYYPRNHLGFFGRLICQQDYSAVTAACMMMPKKVFEELNGLDESFKVAFNDVDLCMRIRKAGYNIIFTPYAELYHYESISRGTEDTVEKQERFNGEVRRFKARWNKELEAGDPFYNPNLTLEFEDFSLK